MGRRERPHGHKHSFTPSLSSTPQGGTSTDVSRFAGSYEHVHESTTAGVTIQAPQLDINTVAAGGGSRLFYRNGLVEVGPESAGAHPGPLCYRKGGHAAVTDANLVLGRIAPAFFPAIFGPSEDAPLDAGAAEAGMRVLADQINEAARAARQAEKSLDEVREMKTERSGNLNPSDAAAAAARPPAPSRNALSPAYPPSHSLRSPWASSGSPTRPCAAPFGP